MFNDLLDYFINGGIFPGPHAHGAPANGVPNRSYAFTALDYAANYVALTIPIPLALFIYFYGTKPARSIDGTSKWYRRRLSRVWMSTRIGQTLMWQKVAWLIYILFVLASLFFPTWVWGRDVTRFVLYTLIVVLAWEMFFGLRQLQRAPVATLVKEITVVPDDSVTEGTTIATAGLLVEHDTQPVPVIRPGESVEKGQLP